VEVCCGEARIYKELHFVSERASEPWPLAFVFGDDFSRAVRRLAGREVSSLPDLWQFKVLLQVFKENIVPPPPFAWLKEQG
jgi:hypothetical protein